MNVNVNSNSSLGFVIGFRRDLHVSGFVPPCEFGPLTLGGALATKLNDETQ